VLMVPVLVYIAKLPASEAIAMSLLIVGLASASGTVKYWKRGFVNWRLAFLFALPGMVASFLGARLTRFVSSDLLLFTFGVLTMGISIILYNKSSKGTGSSEQVVCRPAFTLSIGVGAVIGFLTGLLGVGGGFLIVPAIALLMKCSLYTAIGTSLVIIAVNSIAGLSGHLSTMKLNIPLSVMFLSATIGGAIIGARISDKLNTTVLQKVFSTLIFLVGVFMTTSIFLKRIGVNQ